jgi:hypothetical protein
MLAAEELNPCSPPEENVRVSELTEVAAALRW